MKIIKITTISILLLSLLFPVFFTLADYNIEVSIPGGPAKNTPVTLGQYLRYIYLFALGIAGVAAVGSIVVGGFLYMFSDTVISKEQAKGYITSAIKGLVLALAAYLILFTINPDLVSLKGPTLPDLSIPSNIAPPQPNTPNQPNPTNPNCISTVTAVSDPNDCCYGYNVVQTTYYCTSN